MAQPKLRAEFFARPDGVCIPKAPPLKRSDRWPIFVRDKWRCKECRRPVKPYGNTVNPYREPWEKIPGAIDHIFPRSRGGQNDPSNLRALCINCNASKGAK